MELSTFEHHVDSGWTIEEFPPLDSENTLVLVFGSRDYLDAPESLSELRQAYPQSHLIGCSSSGEIQGTQVSDQTLSVAVAKFEGGRIETATVKLDELDASFDAGKALAEKFSDPKMTHCFVLSNGTSVNGTKLVEGLNSVLDEASVVTGGLAGDGDRFETTWVLDGDRPDPSLVSGVAFYGDNFCISHGSQGGWDRFGPERRVTRSEGSVLYELDGKPALQLYKRYLGDQAEGLPATGLLFPLELHPEGDERLVRTILAIDEEDQSMTFAGDIPEGIKVQLMKANFNRLVEGASTAAEICAGMHDHDAPQSLAIAISCVGRRLILKQRTEDELEAVAETLPKGAEIVGFYSYGELSPYVAGSDCALHNQTMTLTVISEK